MHLHRTPQGLLRSASVEQESATQDGTGAPKAQEEGPNSGTSAPITAKPAIVTTIHTNYRPRRNIVHPRSIHFRFGDS